MKKIGFISYIIVLSLVITAMLSITACDGRETDESEESVSFTDALGREVSVPKSPKRVAALLGSFADVWVLSGGELCAAAEDAREDFGLELDPSSKQSTTEPLRLNSKSSSSASLPIISLPSTLKRAILLPVSAS